MKIGEMLIEEGLITEEQLKETLILQKTIPDKKLGEILIEKGYLSYSDFEKILTKQLEYLDLEALKKDIEN
ncbi:MAG TPA: hypothetical protein PKW55_07945 [Spirochaetota bacterium]|mgnify:CR=1 FL=1|nr:hypothetical protein [Spirochaetota bacterium]HOM38827.1 hypothetical protein [Spirochaetota bacterium]HPQ49885.1 hypothetical protein [Spirochaetota bacterium]